MKPNSIFIRIDKKQADGIWTMDEIILMRKLKKKDERALGKIIDLYSAYIHVLSGNCCTKRELRKI